jgi:hypothetical protein
MKEMYWLLAGTTHEYGRRKEDDNPTVTDFRPDFGHDEKADASNQPLNNLYARV